MALEGRSFIWDLTGKGQLDSAQMSIIRISLAANGNSGLESAGSRCARCEASCPCRAAVAQHEPPLA